MMTADCAAAENHARRALEVAQATGNRAVESWVKIKASHLAIRRGDLDAARSVLSDGLKIALAIGVPSLKFDAVNCFAEILQAQGEASCARQVLAFAANHPAAARLYQDAARERLDKLHAAAGADSNWPELELEDLLHRIVAESNLAHAPLIATLRGELVH